MHAALTAAAASARAAGDDRGKGQVMADALVERVTGQATADAVPVEVQLVITDRALFSKVFGDSAGVRAGGAATATGASGTGFGSRTGADTPAHVPGYGTVPAAWARNLLINDRVQAWLRRLYTHPEDGTLVAMDSRSRTFDGALRTFLIARDGTCRTPWCDAPIAHLDHVVDHAAGGPTTAHNGNGRCVRCNHTKQLPGWRARTDRAGPPEQWNAHTVVLTTPTGHTYRSTAPPLLPGSVDGHGVSVLERHWETVLAA